MMERFFKLRREMVGMEGRRSRAHKERITNGGCWCVSCLGFGLFFSRLPGLFGLFYSARTRAAGTPGYVLKPKFTQLIAK